jgi:septation ring formation regulator EzrA
MTHFTRYNTNHTPDAAIHQIASDFNLSDDAFNYLKQLVEQLDDASTQQEEFDKELSEQQDIIDELERRVETLEGDLVDSHDLIDNLEATVQDLRDELAAYTN